MSTDCCFCKDNDWFRYRVGAIIIADGEALFSYGEEAGYYYTIGGGVHIGERAEDAVLREVYEETGGNFSVLRPLGIVENFFKGDGLLDGLDCHTIEMYYLMKPEVKREYDVGSVTNSGEHEKMCWLPIEKIDEYDVRPGIVKKILKNIPPYLVHYVNDDRN